MRNAHPRLHAGALPCKRLGRVPACIDLFESTRPIFQRIRRIRRVPFASRPVNRACLSRRALSTGRAASCNAHPRLHAGAHTEPSTEQLSIRRRHRQTLNERLADHLQTLSERPEVSCPGPVCVAQFVVLRACVTVCGQNRPSELRGASRARAWSNDGNPLGWLARRCLQCTPPLTTRVILVL